MVCKEEIFLWFRTLKGARRLEVLCGLLNMCYPLEVRFCATCTEELASRDYKALRDDENKANDLFEISRFKGVFDPLSRSKMVLSLSLLRSSNYECSREIFRTLSEEIHVDTMVNADVFSNIKCVDEILLLLTMAQNHPAFTFQQQTYLSELCSHVEATSMQNQQPSQENASSCWNQGISSNNLGSLLPDRHVNCPGPSICFNSDSYDVPSLATTSHNLHHHHPVIITNLKVRPPHKVSSFRIRVSFSLTKSIHVFKTLNHLVAFHRKLQQLFPQDMSSDNVKFIPELPSPLIEAAEQEDFVIDESLTACVSEYIQNLKCFLPEHILQHDFFVSFFLVSSHGRGSLPMSVKDVTNGSSDVVSQDHSKLPSKPVYKAGIPEPVASENLSTPLDTSDVFKALSQTSPLMSPTSSTYVSPTNSETNSRSASPWVQRVILPEPSTLKSNAFEKLLIKENLHSHWEILKPYKMDEIQSMPQETLESLGIPKEAIVRIRKIVEEFGSGMRDTECSNINPTVYSEISSPPTSPSPIQEPINQTSSCTDEAEKGTSYKISDPNMGHAVDHTAFQDPSSKRQSETLTFTKSVREVWRPPASASTVAFPVNFPTSVIHVTKMQGPNPSFLPMQCRTNAGVHLPAGGMVFDGQFSRVPSQSALTFFPMERNLTPNAGLPITTLCPFPVVTSGCNTVPSATNSFASNKSGNITIVTSSVASGNGSQNRQFQKTVQSSGHDSDVLPKQPAADNIYSANYLESPHNTSPRTNSAQNCSCITSSITQPSPSLPMSSTAQQTSIPPYVGLPYVFPHSFSYMHTHSRGLGNGYLQPGTMPPRHGFTFAMPNGLPNIAPEMYGPHVFTPSPATPPLLPSPVSQCYGTYTLPSAPAPSISATHVVKIITCYNCGRIGHRGADCKERPFDEANPPGKFQLNFTAAARPLESRI